jgi:hypothetical protein
LSCVRGLRADGHRHLHLDGVKSALGVLMDLVDFSSLLVHHS